MRWPVALILFASLTSLVGCSTLGLDDDDAEAKSEAPVVDPSYVVPEVIFVPEPGLSARQRLKKAITLLAAGEAEQARAELGAYLQEVPNSKWAGSLIQQIETDPTELFGAVSYAYKMQRGESLSIIAERALGDPMLFYALARYNDIDVPSAIKAGQIIRVPGTAPPVVAKTSQPVNLPEPASDEPEPVGKTEPAEGTAEKTAEPRLEAAGTDGAPKIGSKVDPLQDLMATAQGLSDKSNFRGAATLYEEGIIAFPENANLKRLAATNYANHAGQLSASGQLGEAAEALRRAVELDPDDPDLVQRLAGIERQTQANLLYTEGLDLYADDRLEDAYGSFDEAAALDPKHLGAREKMEEIAPLVAKRWHREGMVHYWRHEPEIAVVLFEKVLAIDPAHTEAQVYLIKAKELDENLKNLNLKEQ